MKPGYYKINIEDDSVPVEWDIREVYVGSTKRWEYVSFALGKQLNLPVEVVDYMSLSDPSDIGYARITPKVSVLVQEVEHLNQVSKHLMRI